MHIWSNTLILEPRQGDEISKTFQILYPSGPHNKQTNLTAKAKKFTYT